MSRVAVVTDSASDLSPEAAAALGVSVVPLVVSFGSETFKAGVQLSAEEFWQRMIAPDAPFPTTAASSPGDFRAAYEAAFDGGAEAVVSISVAGTLSGALKSAQIAASLLPDREIHIVDSWGASMTEGILAEMAVGLAARGLPAAEIARTLEARTGDIALVVVLDTIEYLRRGGRISGAQAAFGTLLSVKPIIRIRNGLVETADRVRTRGKARERLIELITERPIERLAVLYTAGGDGEAFRDELLARVGSGIDRARTSVTLVGPSIGPHIGPGCVGAVALYEPTGGTRPAGAAA